jgi:sterol desaturase/sphingolipid hydroxylase (fatty acid hydroxylase superfamily)
VLKKEKYPSIRIFENPILESLTHVHPIIPLIVWTPIVAYLIYHGSAVDGMTINDHLLWAPIGLLVWTLTEYVLHRVVFHWNSPWKWGQYLVFLFHGLHHDDPNDPTRLVFPPVPAIAIVLCLYALFALVVPAMFLEAFMAYFLIGYLCYDYIHYATHHFKMTSVVGRYLRKYHLQHHFSKEESKYGVSNPLWDYIFGTVTGPKKDHR